MMQLIHAFQSNGYQIISNGIEFKGVRMHGGNRSKDTHGCPLVAFNRLDNDTIQGTAEKKLLELSGASH